MRNRPVYMCGLPVGGLQTNSPSRVPKFYLELMWGLMYHTCFLSSQAGLSVSLGIRYRPVCCETKSVIWYMSCSGARACLFAGCDCAVQQHAQLRCCSPQRARPSAWLEDAPKHGRAYISAPSRRGRTCLPRRSLRGGPWPLRGKSSRKDCHENRMVC